MFQNFLYLYVEIPNTGRKLFSESALSKKNLFSECLYFFLKRYLNFKNNIFKNKTNMPSVRMVVGSSQSKV